ncbi:hypothetical protein SYNPS1DRAFT_27952 [Syncephalis pseudoplumigaleata]|uniref:Uncharacterized protein n=1 Tax=Syncephalis pseudoplumigaleata TaxID=1712513 RepID=A0A4P9Z1W1_9FUNG|nr:hypothetical protein SYNPS1DRAFT_27952 [Syncephalis pseudoplumigaleata]|eukprot:RKP26356.1 hypothetical protein SYNPS1DRAFT_27952 [Syncephalis pseudoplumigaleata]
MNTGRSSWHSASLVYVRWTVAYDIARIHHMLTSWPHHVTANVISDVMLHRRLFLAQSIDARLHVGEHAPDRSADYHVRFPVISALLDMDATEDQICELMAITAIMGDIDDSSLFRDTLGDASEPDAAPTAEPSDAATARAEAASEHAQTPAAHEPSHDASPVPNEPSHEMRQRRLRAGLRRTHQSFATEMETQFNQLYQRYFLHFNSNSNSNDDDDDIIDDVDDDELLLAEQHRVSSLTQQAIRSLHNHMRFLREVRNRRAALAGQPLHTDDAAMHGTRAASSVREQRQRRRWGMIFSRYSFDEDWAVTSSSPSSPHMPGTRRREDRPSPPPAHLLEHRSTSFADMTSIHDSLAHRLVRQRSRLWRNDDDDDVEEDGNALFLFMENDAASTNEPSRHTSTDLLNRIERVLAANEEDTFDYEDLLMLSELIGEVRLRGASEYQLAMLKQSTVEEYTRCLDGTTDNAALYR